MALAEALVRELDPQVRSYIEGLESTRDALQEQNKALADELQVTEEKLRLALLHRFGRSSERSTAATGQVELFTEAEASASDGSDSSDTVTVASHTKRKPGRKPIDSRLPRFERVIDIADEDKSCACGHSLIRIGEEVTERIQVIPEQMWVERIVRPKYACRACEGSGDEDRPAVRIAPAEPTVVPKGIATPSLIAFILANKFVDHLPFYRQEQRFARIGIDISRQDMSNWAIVTGRLVAPLIERFHTAIRGGPLINMDETPVQVMKEPDRSDTAHSYMWLARGGPPESPVTLYHYAPTRSTDVPRSLLEGYQGYLQTDGYKAYRSVADEQSGITRVGCLAHVRRRFHEAMKASTKAGAAHEGMKYITGIYAIERKLRDEDLPDELFVARRREQVQPILDRFHTWLTKKSATIVPSSLTGKAVSYALSEWGALVHYLDHAAMTPDNNAAERAIRPFVLGRKNWLFSGSPRGATASCAIYSLIETAKQNGLNPFMYLYHVLDRVPHAHTDEDWDALMPANLSEALLPASLPIPGQLV